MSMTTPATKSELCTVYRSSREAELYVYVRRADALSKLPPELLDKLGSTSEVLTLKLTPDRKLARVKATDVLAAIAAKGYYLQLPPDFNPSRFTQGG
ncbi:MAG: YcgL domain-containing protein [Pseudomonadota bacterium]